MEGSDPSKKTQPSLVESILENGQLAFNPELPVDVQELNKTKLDDLLDR